MTASTNGFTGSSIPEAMDIANGAMIIAVALFDTAPLSNWVARNIIPMKYMGADSQTSVPVLFCYNPNKYDDHSGRTDKGRYGTGEEHKGGNDKKKGPTMESFQPVGHP